MIKFFSWLIVVSIVLFVSGIFLAPFVPEMIIPVFFVLSYFIGGISAIAIIILLIIERKKDRKEEEDDLSKF
ncbi:MAG: hypothetical protein ACOYVK_05600 [Bacillota bacterium]